MLRVKIGSRNYHRLQNYFVILKAVQFFNFLDCEPDKEDSSTLFETGTNVRIR